MKERMKRIIAAMLIGILILVQYTFQAPVTASQTEQGVTFSGETGTESGETEEATETIIEISTEIVVSEGGITETSEEEQIEATTEVVNSEENSEENEYTTSEENAGEGTTEVFTSEEVNNEIMAIADDVETVAEGDATTSINTNNPLADIPEENKIATTTFAPYNRLRILSSDEITNSDNVEITVVGMGGWEGQDRTESPKYKRVNYQETTTEEGKVTWTNKSDTAVYHGTWSEAISQIYSSFQGKYDAISAQFCGSDTNSTKEINGETQKHDYYALIGWPITYFDIDQTPMWIRVKYKGSVTYDGKPVICIATLKVTPFKNRTTESYGKTSYEYINYYPTLQISELLYNGWVWQNVKDCQAILEFYYDKNPTSTTTTSSTINDDITTVYTDSDMGEKISLEPTTYSSYIGNYYTINSLNPQGWGDNGDNDGVLDTEDHKYGPEYVLPQGDNNVYVINGSNIVTSYTGGDVKYKADESIDYFVTSDWNDSELNWFYDNKTDIDGSLTVEYRKKYLQAL